MQQEIYNNSEAVSAGILVEEEYAEYQKDGVIADPGVMPSRHTLLAKLPRIIMASLVFLLPVFFLPAQNFSLQGGKMLLLGILVPVALALWAFAQLKEGCLRVPGIKLVLALIGIPVAFVVATLFSPSFQASLIGVGAETGTLLGILVLSSLALLTAFTVRTTGDAFTLYAALLMAFVLVGGYQVARLLLGFDVLTFGVFSSSVANLAGKWNDFGIFSGLAALVSLLTLEMVPLRGAFKALAWAILALSLFFIILVNFSTIWVVTAVFVAGVVVYKMSLNRSLRSAGEAMTGEYSDGGSIGRSFRLPVLSTAILVISVIFSVTSLLRADPVAAFLTREFNISHLEARPSWGSTLNIMGDALSANPVFGIGPNRFSTQWIRNKPSGINESVFWSVDFNSGIGTLPTFAVTTGVLGILALLAFLTVFVRSGLRSIFSEANNPFESYLTVSAFFAAAYGWVMMIFYTPGPVPVSLAFVFTGLFIAMVAERGIERGRVINFTSSPMLSFIFSSAFIIVALVSLTSVYLFTSRHIAEAARVKGLIAFVGGESIGSTMAQIERSVRLYDSDRARRDLAELNIRELNSFLSQQSDLTGEAAVARFRDLLGAAIDHARRAQDIDPANYQNWTMLGDVYAAIVPLGIEGAYDNSSNAYGQALALNPTNPQISLKMARLEAQRGNAEEARKYVDEALSKKSNYSEAVFFLAQLEIQEGNIEAAVQSAEAASLLSPNDSVVFFQLGLLYYHSERYDQAVQALGRSVGLNSQYANARYFLGLSYSQLDQRSDAVTQFEEIEKFNQDNQEVKFILSNLRAGRAPFANAAPPIDESPEDREELPIEEE
jgi:tetratricopeptide (TPR) repeat protein